MMMQPELSHWNPHTAFLDQESLDYYTAELRQILRCLANHPSFVMLTFGNELWTDEEASAVSTACWTWPAPRTPPGCIPGLQRVLRH